MADVAKWLAEGRYDLVADHARTVLHTDPGNVEALYYAGVAAFWQGQTDDARLHLRKAVGLAPHIPDIQHALGLCHLLAGDAQAALPYFQRAVHLSPNFTQAQANLAQTLADTGRSEEALEAFDAAIAIDDTYAQAYVGKGDLLWRLNRPEAALTSYRAALDLRPDLASVRYKAATLLPRFPADPEAIGFWRQRIKDEAARLTASPSPLTDPAREVGRTLFYLAYHGGNDRDIQSAVAAMYLASCPRLGYVAPHCAAESGTRKGVGKIKVGFISAYLGRHTLGDLNRRMIAGLPRERFEVTIYSIGPQQAESLTAMTTCADRVVELPSGLAAMQERVAADAPDVVYYPEIGMSPETYFLAFARLAPVQCVTWGHPDTTGIPNMDYFVTLDDAELPDIDGHYSETPIRLPRLITFPEPPPHETRESRADLGLAGDRNAYVCLQAPFKIHPDMDDILAAILKADPKAAIYLLGGREDFWEQALLARLETKAGEMTHRVHVLPPVPHHRFLDILREADVLLDAPHFSGGKTTLESLWVDRPVVTLPSDFMRGRVSLAYYRQIGVMECVAQSKEDYVRRAVRIATDKAYADSLREKIHGAKATLFNNPTAIDAHAEFFESAVAQARDKSRTDR